MEFYGLPPHEKKSRKRAHDDVEEIKLDEEEDDFDETLLGDDVEDKAEDGDGSDDFADCYNQEIPKEGV